VRSRFRVWRPPSNAVPHRTDPHGTTTVRWLWRACFMGNPMLAPEGRCVEDTVAGSAAGSVGGAEAGA
jgi:hypothetical protein